MASRRIPTALLLAAAFALAACSTGAPGLPMTAPRESAVAPSTVARPAEDGATSGLARLDPAVVPSRYDLELDLDPARDAFSGTVEIELELAQATDAVVLHASETITVAAATLDEAAATVERLDEARIAIALEVPLEAGTHRLAIAFSAPLEASMMGLYRVEVAGDWYAFTQMEPISARAAVPCFDEPRFKSPWRVSLVTPEGLVAAANAPLVEQTPGPRPGTTRHVFAPTPPIPSYLLALAVGPFDVVEAPVDALPDAMPFRILTVRGRGNLVDYPLAMTGPVLAALADYFAQPYPYAKLDFVAVPNFSAGAMENPGLVTYRETLLMVAADDPPSTRRSSLNTIAHELAHMWFGNLVTPAWWDELWLNEAFATWMANIAVDAVLPELESRLSLGGWVTYVMSSDMQLAARAVRQPIRSEGDIHNAFDGITYGKGAAVLQMLERWLGSDAFRDGVRHYIAAHAWENATTDDLLQALAGAAGTTQLPEVLSSFVDQPGVPLVTVDWSCEGSTLTVEASQRRLVPAFVEPPSPSLWTIPLCLAFDGGEPPHTRQVQCVMLDQTSARFSLPLEAACPTFVYPNADAQGYYRWVLPPERLLELLTHSRASLTTAERAALPGMLQALFEAGELELAPWLAGLEALAAEEHRLVLGGVIGGLEFLYDRLLSDAQQPAFAAWVRTLLEPHAARLGLEPVEGEAVSDRLLRPQVLGTLAELGRDQRLRERALEAARAFVSDPASVPLDVARQSVPLAAQDGDEALWSALRALLERPELTPNQRSVVLAALGSFREPALLERSLALTLDGTVRGQDLRSVSGGGLATDATAEIVWTWLTTHYTAIRALVGDESAARLPGLGGRFCDADGAARVEAFFSQPEHAPQGTERALAQVLERIERCRQLRQKSAHALQERFAPAQSSSTTKRP